jgi:hypothetical protein
MSLLFKCERCGQIRDWDRPDEIPILVDRLFSRNGFNMDQKVDICRDCFIEYKMLIDKFMKGQK